MMERLSFSMGVAGCVFLGECVLLGLLQLLLVWWA